MSRTAREGNASGGPVGRRAPGRLAPGRLAPGRSAPGRRAAGRRALGLDLGERRIGVAISDSDGVLALPLCTIERTGDRGSDHAEVLRLVEEHGIAVVVVGLPRSLDGTIGAAARAVASETEALSGELSASGVDVLSHDERFTTVEADRALRGAGKKGRERRRTIDQSAAAVLLQAWLASGGRG